MFLLFGIGLSVRKQQGENSRFIKPPDFGVEKFGTGMVLSNKFGTGSAPEKGVWNEIIKV